MIDLNRCYVAGVVAGLLVAGTAALTSCATRQPDPLQDTDALPEVVDTISVRDEGLYPEGVAYDPVDGHFYVGSVTRGTVSRIDEDGTATPIIRDERLISAAGMAVDPERGRLFVATGDLGVGLRSRPETTQRYAGLGVYRLPSGDPIGFIQLDELNDGAQFANDVDVAPDGVAFVTNSFASLVYRVTPELEADVFVRDERFASDGLGLNGIAAEDDWVLVVHTAGGRLFKIDRPSGSVSEVSVDEPLTNGDGLVLLDRNTLAVVQNERNMIAAYRTDDRWSSARRLGERRQEDFAFPTTAVRVGDDVYVLSASLDRLTAGDFSVAEYPLTRVPISELTGESE